MICDYCGSPMEDGKLHLPMATKKECEILIPDKQEVAGMDGNVTSVKNNALSILMNQVMNEIVKSVMMSGGKDADTAQIMSNINAGTMQFCAELFKRTLHQQAFAINAES